MIAFLTATVALTWEHFVIMCIGICTFVSAAIGIATWISKAIKAKRAYDAEQIQKGIKLAQEKQEQENRFHTGEHRMDVIEENVDKLTKTTDELAGLIKLLVESDQQNIKAWMKDQHERWMACGYIDSFALDLMEKRYAIYKKEHGNGWALKIMTDIRALPAIEILPIENIHDQQDQPIQE